ncbi:MAG: rhodanese-like domain-containing protein [Thermoplasmata archaeon]
MARVLSVMILAREPQEVADLLRSHPSELVLLDVRETDERATALIEPSLHIPMNSIPARFHELPRNREIVVYCHTGSRSAMVAAYLEGQGFSQLANLEGGIDAWSRRVDPAVPRY